MQEIDEAIVEQSWEGVASFDVDQAQSEMASLGESQPELLGYVVGCSMDLDERSREMGVYLFFVVYRMFELAYGGPLPTIAGKSIIDIEKENDEMLVDLEDEDDDALELAAFQATTRQPHVMQYVVEALMEAPDDEEAPFELSDEEFGCIFLLLKTVVQVLDQATDA